MLIAASTYLNSAPLVYSFFRGSRRRDFTFIGDAAPSRCAAMLAAGECQIALIPVIEFQRIPGLRLIPEIAVASKNRVRSVLLVSRHPLSEARTVTLDASSRTSQTLVKILFSQRYRTTPRFIERMPDPTVDCQNMLEASDAALVIGDPAMRLESSARQFGLQIYDLAQEWNNLTGLPFVFAVWATHQETDKRSMDLVPELIAAKHEGIANLQSIAAQYSPELNLPETDLLDYLRHNINYDLDAENLAGLRKYFSLAYETGLIPQNRELIIG